MAGITDGVPEVAVGEPIRLGDNGEYELEHDPITDRLIVRDTVNNKEAYVRPETNEQIGNQGAFIRSLVNGEPLADNGRTYSTVQEAERNANGWMFVPPGTFDAFDIDTPNLTVIGSGYGTVIAGGGERAIYSDSSGVTIRNLRARNISVSVGAVLIDENSLAESVFIESSREDGIEVGSNSIAVNCRIESASDHGAAIFGDNARLSNSIIQSPSNSGVNINAKGVVISNNVIVDAGDGIKQFDSNGILIGNRIVNPTDRGIQTGTSSVDNIIANNRVSDANIALDDNGSGTLFDGNITGSAN